MVHTVIYNLEKNFRNLDEVLEVFNTNTLVYPKVPKNRMQGENNVTPRICVADSVEDCITAIGAEKFWMCDRNAFTMRPTSWAYPIVILSFTDESVVKPSELDVPDIDLTGEKWILEPTIPYDICVRWVNSKSMDFVDFDEIVWCDKVWFVDPTGHDHPWLNGKGDYMMSKYTGKTIPKYKLWLDDVRPAPDDSYEVCHSVNEAIATIETWMKNNHYIEVLDLDHDLGEYAPDGGDGIRLLDWLEANNIDLPIRIHSMNPVGRQNMQRIIRKNNWNEIY